MYKTKWFGKMYLMEAKRRGILPLKKSPPLASLCGHLLGDGGIKGDLTQVRFYGSKNKLNSISKDYYKLFKKYPKIIKTERTGKSYKITIPDSLVAKCLYLVGVPKGDKCIQPFIIPSWIMDSDKKIKKAFLQALFDDELEGVYKDYKKPNTWGGLKFKMSKSSLYIKEHVSFLNQLRLLLNEFKIETSDIKISWNSSYKRQDKHITYPAYFRIKIKYANRRRFCNSVGFLRESLKKQNLHNSVYAGMPEWSNLGLTKD